MAENQLKPLPPPKHFVTKIVRSAIAGLFVLGISLLIGMVGYHYYFNLGW